MEVRKLVTRWVHCHHPKRKGRVCPEYEDQQSEHCGECEHFGIWNFTPAFIEAQRKEVNEKD